MLGFIRGGGVFDYGYVSKYADGKIIGLKEIKSAEYAIDNCLQKWAKTDYQYLVAYKNWEVHGFTERSGETIERYNQKDYGMKLM